MSDTKWGFDTNYGHRTLPFKWQSSNGFHFYEDSRICFSQFREVVLNTVYAERGTGEGLEKPNKRALNSDQFSM